MNVIKRIQIHLKELGPRTAKLTLLICLKIHMVELV